MSLLLLGCGPPEVGATAFDPATPANLFAWYQPGPAYCFSDNAGTVPCAANDPVAVWKPKSGSGPNWVQTTAGARPLMIAGSGGKYLVRFDGVDDNLSMAGSDPMGALTAAEACAVIRNGAAGTAAWWDFGTGLGGDWMPFNTDVYDSFGSTTRQGPGTPTAVFTDLNTYQVAANGSGWTNWMNGTQLLHAASNTVGWRDPIRLGLSLIAVYGKRDWGDLVLYSAVLSAGDRANLLAYMRTRWGTP